MIAECQESATAAIDRRIRAVLASEINHPLPQVVLTADKKMFIDRNKEDTSIERRYILPGSSPDRRTVALLLLLLTFIPAQAGNATAS